MIYNLIDINKDVCNAWEKVFSGIEEVEIKNESVFAHSFDALVSPANSMGYMNGGIDFSISKNLGWHIEKKLQKKIREKYFGELLVGQAEIVETENSQYPYLISAPTMRTPMTIFRTPNIYLATKAILILIEYGKFEDGTAIKEKVKSVAIPGLGTGVGQVPPLECARQMRIAWEDIKGEKFKSKEGWKEMNANFAFFHTGDKQYLTYDIP